MAWDYVRLTSMRPTRTPWRTAAVQLRLRLLHYSTLHLHYPRSRIRQCHKFLLRPPRPPLLECMLECLSCLLHDRVVRLIRFHPHGSLVLRSPPHLPSILRKYREIAWEFATSDLMHQTQPYKYLKSRCMTAAGLTLPSSNLLPLARLR